MGVPTRTDRLHPRMAVLLPVLIAAAVLTVLLATGLGPVSVSPATTAKVLASRLPVIGSSIPHTWEQLDENIVLGLRLPGSVWGWW